MAKKLAILLSVVIAAATWWQPVPVVAAVPLQQPAPCAVAAAAALSKAGSSYVWGAKGPYQFDCSGLVYWAWTQAGYNIGRSTYDQSRSGVAIGCRLSDLAGPYTTCWEAGDLIFLRYTGGQHVSMYIGNGLFADAYNRSTGVIIHNPAADSFYQAHFWQARRIVDCDGVSIVPSSWYGNPVLSPDLEELPDLLAPVAFTVPQCGDCNDSGAAILPEEAWDGTWDINWFDLGRVFQTVNGWLAWKIGSFFRLLICWMLQMLQILAGILAQAVNIIIAGINGIWKLFLLSWLSAKAWFGALWEMLESIRAMIYSAIAALSGLAGLVDLGHWLIDVSLLVVAILGRLVLLLGQLVLSALNLIGWIGGLALGLILQFQVAIAGTVTPPQLTETHVIYYGVRGLLEGWRDSQVGWILIFLWGLAYVKFVEWLATFLSAGGKAE